MAEGRRSEADVIDAVLRGSIDGAVNLLKRVHDAKQLNTKVRDAVADGLRVDRSALQSNLGDLVYQLGVLQAEFVDRALGLQNRHATALHDRIAKVMGAERPGQAESLRVAAADRAPVRFRVKNSTSAAGVVDVSLKDDALIALDDTVVKSSFAIDGYSDDAPLTLDRDARALVVGTLTIDEARPKGVDLRGTLVVSLGGKVVKTIDLTVFTP
ncbi:MAG: hypothetical protein R3A52_08875 [Polyangiales bacterium]